MSAVWSGLVPTKRRAMMSDHVNLTIPQAMALELVFYTADEGTWGGRHTRVNPTGSHRIATMVAHALIEKGLLKSREVRVGYGFFALETRFTITPLGCRVVRALERRGHDLEWLKAHQRQTKAQRLAAMVREWSNAQTPTERKATVGK